MGKKKLVVIDDSIETQRKNDISQNLNDVGNLSETQVDSDQSVKQSQVISSDPTGISNQNSLPDSSQTTNPISKTLKSQKPPTKIAKKYRSNKYRVSLEYKSDQFLNVDEVIEAVKKSSYTKFDGSIEAHIKVRQNGIRGLVSMPFAPSKKIRILSFGDDQSGADIIGNDQTIDRIKQGKIDFDLIVTTADWMPKLAVVASILGPRGIMPNPKNGTIASDIKKAVLDFQSGKVEYKTESKSPLIHATIGKISQPTEEIVANLKALHMAIGKSKVLKINISPTMGPSFKIDLNTL